MGKCDQSNAADALDKNALVHLNDRAYKRIVGCIVIRLESLPLRIHSQATKEIFAIQSSSVVPG